MALWFKQRDNKEYRDCECCKDVGWGQFYIWHCHPALPADREPLIICTKCTKRELGKKKFKVLKELGKI